MPTRSMTVHYSQHFLEEPCKRCQTLHPWYLLHYFHGPCGQPETYAIPLFLEHIRNLPGHAADAMLSLVFEWDGSLVRDPSTHQPFARIIDTLEEHRYGCLEADEAPVPPPAMARSIRVVYLLPFGFCHHERVCRCGSCSRQGLAFQVALFDLTASGIASEANMPVDLLDDLYLGKPDEVFEDTHEFYATLKAIRYAMGRGWRLLQLVE